MSKGDIELAHAKLTRDLHLVGVREDGFHLIESEMVTLDLADRLEISAGSGLEIVDAIAWVGTPRPTIDIPTGSDNLVLRALGLVGKDAHIRLEKRIPAGAGLGGGSADAAAIFRWAQVFDARGAAHLGSDIPFCLRGGRAFVSGVGEVLAPLAYEQASYLVLIPDLVVSTAAVYRSFDDLVASERVRDARNDLERAALVVEPRLSWWRDLLAEASGRTPVLAGSGSSWFVEIDATAAETFKTTVCDAVVSAGAVACVEACQTVEAIAPTVRAN